jgi:uncharacterized protein DUF6525
MEPTNSSGGRNYRGNWIEGWSEMDAFDALPPELRAWLASDDCFFNFSAMQAWFALKELHVEELIAHGQKQVLKMAVHELLPQRFYNDTTRRSPK